MTDNKKEERLLKAHQPCDDCGSSDALALYEHHSFCHSCGKYSKINGDIQNASDDSSGGVPVHLLENDGRYERSTPSTSVSSRVLPVPSEGYKDHRSISHEVLKKYGVWSRGGDQYYPYYKGNTHVANKIRTVATKGFLAQGNISGSGLFGQQLFPPGGKTLTITEGELDALSTFQAFGSKYPAVSVKSASSAEKDVTDNWEYVNSFEQIVLVFDRDEGIKRSNGDVHFPGQEAAQRVAALFPLGKVRVVTLQKAKDANEYLQKGWTKDFISEWWSGPVWTPVGIKLAKDMWSEVSAAKNYETQDYPWDGLNEYTYGLRLSELVTITAQSGIGKTSVVKEIEHALLKNTQAGVGILHLEEPNGDTLLGLMSITANKPLHIPDVRKEVEDTELRRYYDETCNTERIVIWDHFGSNEIDGVLNTVRYMKNLGCKYIFIDHLSIIVSDQSGDERKQLDEISTKLKTLCMELNIAVICVIHQNRQGEIRGTAGVEQLSNMVFKLHRDKEDSDEWRRNVTKVSVQKNRFCGKTGPACYLWYDGESGRLMELNKDQIARYEAGGTDLKPLEDFKHWDVEHSEGVTSEVNNVNGD